MATGKVKWYNELKGYGFIESSEGKDIFIHRTGLYTAFGGLHPEEEVEYEIKNSQRGEYAVNVKLVNQEN